MSHFDPYGPSNASTPDASSRAPGADGRSRPDLGDPAAPYASGHQVDYGLPRLYDTSQRAVPHGVAQPQRAQPPSAWATQTRRIEQVQAQRTPVPVGTIVAWVLAGLLGLILLIVLAGGFITFTLAGSSNPALWVVYALIALLSLGVIIGVIVLADRWDPQPLPLLLIAVFWGAAIAASIAYLANTLNFYVLYAVTGSEGATVFLGSTFGAPVVEETSKGLGLVLLLLVARKYFNGPLDGLVYGALIGGGFAFVENIQYYLSVPEAGGTFTQSLFLVFVRGVVGIFGHSVYTSLTGVVMGLVVRKWGTLPGVAVFLVAPWPGMVLHAGWNGGTSIAQGTLGFGGLVLMLVVEIVFSGLWLALIGLLVFDESRLTRIRLGDYANQGWLTHQEVDLLATWKGRREGRRWARSINAGGVMKTFIRESAALASNRQRLLADGASQKALAEERRLLGRLTANRQALLAHVT